MTLREREEWMGRAERILREWEALAPFAAGADDGRRSLPFNESLRPLWEAALGTKDDPELAHTPSPNPPSPAD